MLVTFVLSNIVIALSYVAISLYLVPRFSAFKISWLVSLFRAAFVIFFFTCGMSHVEMAVHATTGSAEQVAFFTSSHMVINHVVQAIAALVGGFLAWKFVYVSIGPTKAIREYISGHPSL